MMRPVPICPICGHEKPAVVAEMDAARRERFKAYGVRKYGGVINDWADDVPLAVLHCPNCTHSWLSHQPDEAALTSMYAACRQLYGEGAPVDRDPSVVMRKEMRRLRRLIGGEGTPTLLDYGSGFGRWARAAVAEGFQVTAFEPSSERGAEREQTGFELVHHLEELKGHRFDVIHLEQVLEHVPNPLPLLKEVRAFGHAGTILRLTVPNVLRAPEGARIWDSWPYDGARTHTLAPFEHLHGFTPRSLGELAEGAGLKPLEARLLWRHYTSRQIRQLASFLWPQMGQTLFLARLA